MHPSEGRSFDVHNGTNGHCSRFCPFPALPARRHGGKHGVELGGQFGFTAPEGECDTQATPSFSGRRWLTPFPLAEAEQLSVYSKGCGAN